VKAWSESKQKILFSGHKQLRTKVENRLHYALMLHENDSICDVNFFIVKLQKLLIAPRRENNLSKR